MRDLFARGLHLFQVLFSMGNDEHFDGISHRYLTALEMKAGLATLRWRRLADDLNRRFYLVVQLPQLSLRRVSCQYSRCKICSAPQFNVVAVLGNFAGQYLLELNFLLILGMFQ